MPLAAGPAPTTITINDLRIGTGPVVAQGAKVTVNYVGVACSTGKIFDSSYSHGGPFLADLSVEGNLIMGWQEGVPGMKVGGVRMLSIPPILAYGRTGQPPIASTETLFFVIEAVKLG